jgi:hypothetical protein
LSVATVTGWGIVVAVVVREKNWLFVVIVIVIEQFVNDINSTVGILSSDASLSMFLH